MMDPSDLPDEELKALSKIISAESTKRNRVTEAKRGLYDAFYRATRTAGMSKEQVIKFIEESY